MGDDRKSDILELLNVMFPTDDAELLTNNDEESVSEILFIEQLLNKKYPMLLVATIRNNVAFPTPAK